MKRTKQNGITLIALVITIIVLLILAGATIATLTGDNGILTQANNAKERTEEASLEEKIQLLATETLINKYTGKNEEKTAQEIQNELNEQGENVLVIQWDKYIIFDLEKNEEYRVMSDGNVEYWGENNIGNKLNNLSDINESYIGIDSQGNQVIGVDSIGNQVNMKLWESSLMENATYGLNDKESLAKEGSRSPGYDVSNLEDGKIIGEIPEYIKKISDDYFTSVTSIQCLFYQMTELTEFPKLPDTLINMRDCFNGCIGITSISYIPDSVTNMQGTFFNCSNLAEVLNFPTFLENMSNAFRGCKSLNSIPDSFPDKIETMRTAFYDCSSLKESPPKIPDTTTDIAYLFSNCTNLEKSLNTIGNNVITMNEVFSNCINLQEVPATIPNSVINMESAFYNCKKLEKGPTILSNNVTNIAYTFFGCTSLINLPEIIPHSVINMIQTFNGCSSASGNIEINANLNGKVIYVINGTEFNDYYLSFKDAGINSEGIRILKSSSCPVDILTAMTNQSSKVSLEE